MHAIPLYGIKQGLLTVEKSGKKNAFSGRMLEIEGLEDLTAEQAFELSDASAERSAAGKLLEKQPAGSLRTRLWLAPPTRTDQHQLTEEGYYGIYGRAGARMEMPGCSLCMGNQARVAPKSTVVSTSTRNFPNRLGDGANVYLVSAELAAVAAVVGRLPTVEEYQEYMGEFNVMAGEIYRYMNFHEIEEFQKAASNVIPVAQEA